MATKKRSNGNGNGHGKPSGEREQRELECVLTEGEFTLRSDAMADCELEIEKLKEQRKGLNGAIAAAAAERQRLAHVIETRRETRMVDCAWNEDFRQNVKRLIRQDTGAEVDTKPMTAADRQGTLALLPSLPPVDAEPAAPQPTAAAAPKKRGRPRKDASPSSTTHAHA